ncbi:MAG: ribonuclease HII [Clostridiales bacterium]|nr:ribonuclease HII [Clostridiales bacterium]
MKKVDYTDRYISLTEFETPLWAEGLTVVGADEVGRGPLAGPVVCACVSIAQGIVIDGIDDSKKVSEKKRIRLNELIRENCSCVGLGWAWQSEIDELNILEATKKAFVDAYKRAASIKKPDVLLIDAVSGLDLDVRQLSIIHGDARSYLIAAASIIAKVARDAYMIEMDKIYPMYGFARNKGYGTKEHIDALKRFGPCELHRRTFIKNFF